MADTNFVDVGDELVVSVAGHPVGKATVTVVNNTGIRVEFYQDGVEMVFILPPNFAGSFPAFNADEGPPVGPPGPPKGDVKALEEEVPYAMPGLGRDRKADLIQDEF